MRTCVEDRVAHCPRCKRVYSVALMSGQTNTYFACHFCDFEQDAPFNGAPDLETLYDRYFNQKGEWHHGKQS